MDKAKLTKIALKLAVGAVTSVLIGATIKQEKRVGDLIDGYFENKTNTTV